MERAFDRALWQFPVMVRLPSPAASIHMHRRTFLRSFGAAALGLAAIKTARAGCGEPRSLSFVHTHTAERLTAVYYEAGAYCPTVLRRVNELLRDFRTETVFPIDPMVLDRLFELQSVTGGTEPFQVICGYRSPATNEALRKASGGVAEHSLHMEGRAIDVRLPGVATARLAVLARRQAGGGVGYYQVSDFVHLDTGRTRVWGDPVPL
jgi:uncharacterized protein YcbK (DUF882 family)